MMRSGIIPDKYFKELRQRVESRAWDAVYSGSDEKLQEQIKLVINEITKVRTFFLERGVLIPDSKLLKTNSPEFKAARDKWLREQEQKAREKEQKANKKAAKAAAASKTGTQTTLVN